MSDPAKGFFVAPFAADGSSQGVGFWNQAHLSGFWLDISRGLMVRHGNAFDTSVEKESISLRVKFSAAEGVGLLSYFIEKSTVWSCLLLSGRSAEVEKSLTGIFVDSLRMRSSLASSDAVERPFAALSEITQRPLLVVVHALGESISEETEELAREFGLSFAGAFFFLQS